MDYHFGHPYYILSKPCGSVCNLACTYCYFIDKATGRISDALLEHFIQQYIQTQPTEDVLFIWHGGEPMLMGTDFYRRVLYLQRQYAHGRNIGNVMQTNGTLITDEWASFFHDNMFLVGVSIDGPEHLHNIYRKHRSGKGTWQQVMHGIETLNRHHVEWNAMAVVNRRNADHPLEVYRFFKSIACRYIQFTPIVEQTATGTMTEETVPPDRWGRFLNAIFDEWSQGDIGTYFVETFDATLANRCGVEPGVCSFAKTCGLGMAMQPNGDVYSCDHFVHPRYKLGNIGRNSLIEMAYGERQKQFGRAKSTRLADDCKRCEFLHLCRGGCPKDRLADNKNYLCEGYKAYFAHVAPAMDVMARKWMAGETVNLD